MNIQNNKPGPQNSDESTSQDSNPDAQKSSEISLPRVDRPEGPFEHSGETARWTEEEKEEKNDEANQPGGHTQGQSA